MGDSDKRSNELLSEQVEGEESDINRQTKKTKLEQPEIQAAAREASTSCDIAGTRRNGKLKLPKPEKDGPCPRCKSNDTKFCYYNNYNLNQPRYFCRVRTVCP